ncbi:hypothetical protein DPEC_G00380100, partial [Dallia pectoralis]
QEGRNLVPDKKGPGSRGAIYTRQQDPTLTRWNLSSKIRLRGELWLAWCTRACFLKRRGLIQHGQFPRAQPSSETTSTLGSLGLTAPRPRSPV